MKINTRFLKEAQELEKRWVNSSLLQGMKATMSKAEVAAMLECERLHNETGTWDCCDKCRERQEKVNHESSGS